MPIGTNIANEVENIMNDNEKMKNLQKYLEKSGLDKDQYWAKQEANLNNIKKIVHVLYDQQFEGVKTFKQFKKAANYRDPLEDRQYRQEKFKKIEANKDVDFLGFKKEELSEKQKHERQMLKQ